MEKILIIEDEMSIAELERDYLEVHGYECHIVNDGEEGYQQALSNSYDLIILDLMLPRMDGFTLCKKIRDVIEVPILMVTARTEDIDKIRGLNIGADDYILKPFNPNELVARVQSHINRYKRLTKRDQSQEWIQLKDITIDLTARKVYVNEEEKSMTAKEFDLLVFLATYPNRVFTKEHLFERIWGFDSMGDVSTVTVHIRKIREKIEKDPSNPEWIETIWGVGYRFNR
jgi:DNA-binding response OmpR family regulator